MKILTTQGEELASIKMLADKSGRLDTSVTVGDLTIDAPPMVVAIEKGADALVAHVRILGTANMDVLIEPQDLKQMLKIPVKGIVSFGVKALLSGRQ